MSNQRHPRLAQSVFLGVVVSLGAATAGAMIIRLVRNVAEPGIVYTDDGHTLIPVEEIGWQHKLAHDPNCLKCRAQEEQLTGKSQ